MLRALEYTRRRLQRPGHVTGRELLEGARGSGPGGVRADGLEVLQHWGLTGTVDFGRIVYDLIEADLLRKTDEDIARGLRRRLRLPQAFEQDYRW